MVVYVGVLRYVKTPPLFVTHYVIMCLFFQYSWTHLLLTHQVCCWHVLVNVFYCFITISGGFVEVPRSLNVTVDAKATFQCSHPRANVIVWLINTTEINRHTEIEGTFHVNFRGNVLTVTALPEYNTTVIQCQAYFFTGSITSTAAILNIQG